MFSQQEKEAIYDLARVEMSNFPPQQAEEQEEQIGATATVTEGDEDEPEA